MEENLKRLNKFIGETGYCSRREADKIIEEVWQLKNKEAGSKPADSPADKATDKPSTETAPAQKPAETPSK